jgi:Flp pilus assembly pilin Flp
MVRRAVVQDPVAYSEATVVEHTPVATVIANVVSVVYVAVMSLLALDTLLRALGARPGNGFVHAIRVLTQPLVAPFTGMFARQTYWASALIAAVVYTALFLIATTILRRDRTI